MQILGKTYDVYFVDDSTLLGNLGSANREKGVIKINVDISAEQIKDSIIHEVLHILDMELKLGLSEENICRLAAGLYSAGFSSKLNVEELVSEAKNSVRSEIGAGR